jgi:hypothetical protein
MQAILSDTQQAENKELPGSLQIEYQRTPGILTVPDAPGKINRSLTKNPVKTLISSLWNRLAMLAEDNEDRSVWPAVEQCECDDCKREAHSGHATGDLVTHGRRAAR